MTVPLRPSHPPLRLTFPGRVARRSACVLAAVERLSLPVGRSQRRDAGACCVRAWPRPFPSPSPPPSPGLPRPRRTAGLVTRSCRRRVLFSFFLLSRQQPAPCLPPPPPAAPASCSQTRARGARGASPTPERATGARRRRSGSRRRGSCERPPPGGRRAVPGVSCHRDRGAAGSGIVSLARPAGCQGLGVGAHRPGGTPGNRGRPPASAALGCLAVTRRGPAGPGAGRAAGEAVPRPRGGPVGRFAAGKLSGGGRGTPPWPRPACGVALAAGEFRVETTVASLGRG